jgi:arabinofuranosyltransferase
MRRGIVLLFGVTLALLLAHTWLYHFLTDDAFISFRYSVNLAQGHGLVFNPGGERVEGYSNFLWVLILAGLDLIGIKPEQAAIPLSMLLTAALWALVAWFSWRQRRSESAWISAVPLLLLAATRSIAVWSTSGLETRLFEVLVLAGALRLIVEAEALARGEKPLLLAPWAFALATLTRPDGLLVSVMAFAVAGLWLRARSRTALPRWLAGLLPFAVLVGAHFVWRHAYYGDWLPNTYYAKVDGRSWWSSGFAYLSAFGLEYGALLWLPVAAVGAWWNARRERSIVPLVFAAVIVPHAIYIASIGGDHFEYRPLDLYFPFLYLLVADGLRAWSEHRARTPVIGATRASSATPLMAAWLAVSLVGIVDLPWRSHAEFPTKYITGFPGVPLAHDPQAQSFLDPARDPIYRWWPMRAAAETHRDQIRALTANFVGVRQEEHRMFLATVIPEGERIRSLINQGVLPADVYVAMGSVGAIPYYARVRTLDRVGLTDAHVAHSPVTGRRLMAHDKAATIDYARERGVDLWTYDPVHLIEPPSGRRMLVAVRDALVEGKDAWVAELSDSEYVLCRLPLGVDSTARRIPRLRFVPVTDPAFMTKWGGRAAPVFEAALARDSSDIQSLGQLAFVELVSRDYDRAAARYERLLSLAPDSPEAWEYLAACRVRMGDKRRGLAAIERGLEQDKRLGDPVATKRLESERLAILRELESDR